MVENFFVFLLDPMPSMNQSTVARFESIGKGLEVARGAEYSHTHRLCLVSKMRNFSAPSVLDYYQRHNCADDTCPDQTT